MKQEYFRLKTKVKAGALNLSIPVAARQLTDIDQLLFELESLFVFGSKMKIQVAHTSPLAHRLFCHSEIAETNDCHVVIVFVSQAQVPDPDGRIQELRAQIDPEKDLPRLMQLAHPESIPK